MNATKESPPDTLQPLGSALVDLLLEIAIGVHRFGMYPSDHPIIESLGVRLAQRLNAHTIVDGPLQVGVSSKQLLVGVEATDVGHPILRELSRKLREKGVGALTFQVDVSPQDVEELLRVVAEETPESEELGIILTGDSIQAHTIGYDALELAAAGMTAASTRATDLWLGLARAAMSAGTIENDDAVNVKGLASHIKNLSNEAGYDQVLMGYMSQLAGVLKTSGGGDEGRMVKGHFAGLLDNLDMSTLKSLLGDSGSSEMGLRFALDVCESLDPMAAVRIMEVAPRGSDQRLSSQMLGVLKKLAAQSEVAPEPLGAASAEAFKEAVGRLGEEWDLRDPAPQRYSEILDGMVSSAVISGGRKVADDLGGNERVVYTALEVDALGATVTEAIRELAQGPGITFLLELIESIEAGHRVGDYISELIHSPEQVRRLTEGSEVDDEALEEVILRIGDAAIAPLIDGLLASESRSVRRVLSDRLMRMGNATGVAAISRLGEDLPWYAHRNLLILANVAKELPATFDPAPFLLHPDLRVRREAFPVCLRVDGKRADTLRLGIRDNDARVVHMALAELRADMPLDLFEEIHAMLRKGGDLAVHAARALGACDSHRGLKVLLDVVRTRTWMGKARLAKPTPVMMASLESLQIRWGGIEEVKDVMALAAISKNPVVRRIGRRSHGGG